MQNRSWSRKGVVIMLACMGLMFTVLASCAASKKVAGKSGAELWADNCQRCHNTPSPVSFNSERWKTIGMHMQSRALLTQNEKEKVVAFLQSQSH